MHQDSPVYFLSQAKSHKVIFSEEDSWLVAALSGMRVGATNQNMSKSILELLQGHSRFQHIQRVCVAERLGISNQLRTVCSATDPSITDTMEAGYSCFLNPQSSIFKISDKNMRLFTDAQKVVSSFKEKGLPVQRSMGRIAAMGLETGVCWGAFRSSVLQGLIFMNGSA